MSDSSNHSGLSRERWARFSWDEQILSIGAEAHRCLKDLKAGRPAAARLSYERILALLELTAALEPGLGRLKETTRLKEFVAGLFIAEPLEVVPHEAMMRSLL